MLLYNPHLKQHAQSLRRNMTTAEQRLWARIRLKQLNGFQFYRQRTIGNYIVDFYCPAGRLVIELDGGHHYFEVTESKDEERTRYITKQGLKVIRFNNQEIAENLAGVVEAIISNLP